MEARPTPWRILVAVVSASACLLTAGCTGDSDADEPDSTSFEPVERVASPESVTPPSGSITASPSGLHSITFDAVSRSVVALSDDSSSLLVFGTQQIDGTPRSVDLPGPAADIVSAGDGTVLLPMQGQLVRVDLRGSDADQGSGGRSTDFESTAVDANLLSAAQLVDGRLAAGDDSGAVHIIDPATSESRVIDGLTSVDGLAATDYGVAALDRRQTSLTQIDLESDSLGPALRAGSGAAKSATDDYGRILVTDAVGGELLVFSSDDLLLRQRFPVGAQPWAVTYDDVSDVAWISTPGTNEVVGYTLDTGIPVEVGRFPTVRAPDSIDVDGETGTLFVGSADGGGLQRIPVGEVA